MRFFLGFLLLTGMSIVIGCGSQAGIDGTTPVTGTVTHQGKPVAGATVVFAPEGSGRSASGMTDASGRFQLTTLAAGDGAMPGKYQVSISKTEVTGDLSREEAEAYFQEHGEAPTAASKELLPEKYKSPTTSELTAEVTDGGPNNFAFDLTN